MTIINDILDVSKIEAGQVKLEIIDTRPIDIVDQVLAMVGPRADEKGVELSVRFETPMPERIQSDPTRLRQILLNLVGNAVKFTEVGEVTIVASCDPETRRLRFQIVDSGIGMTAEQLVEVAKFQPFSQANASTTRRFGGTGLGLRISNVLATMLGGGIEVESTKGQGSTFTVTISAGDLEGVTFVHPELTPQAASADAAGPAPHREPTRLDGLRILLAEDGPDNQRLVSFHLQRAGAEVVVCENGVAAVETIANADPDELPHVILMDMQMPLLDGYGATRQLRNRGVELPIIALTAHAMHGDREKCLDAGCDDYLSKPINVPALLECCRRWAEAKSPSVGESSS